MSQVGRDSERSLSPAAGPAPVKFLWEDTIPH